MQRVKKISCKLLDNTEFITPHILLAHGPSIRFLLLISLYVKIYKR